MFDFHYEAHANSTNAHTTPPEFKDLQEPHFYKHFTTSGVGGCGAPLISTNGQPVCKIQVLGAKKAKNLAHGMELSRK